MARKAVEQVRGEPKTYRLKLKLKLKIECISHILGVEDTRASASILWTNTWNGGSRGEPAGCPDQTPGANARDTRDSRATSAR